MSKKNYKPKAEKPKQVSEPVIAYIGQTQPSLILRRKAAVRAKTLQSFNEHFFDNKLLVINTIRQGVSYALFRQIMAYTPFTESDWADFLDISTKTLQRYKAEGLHQFKPIHSEKIIEMAEVTKAGLEVFGDMIKLQLWLQTPVYALGGLKPIELLKDSYGKEMVMSELIRIDHGILV